jgi:tol-pal system protein YbgF
MRGGTPLRIRDIALSLCTLFLGIIAGTMLTPQPAAGVSKEMIELQAQVEQLLQGQQNLRSALDSETATLRTLVQQSLDSVNNMHTEMSALEKNVGEVSANTTSRIDTMTTQTQGLSDNVQDIQARVGKLSQQLTDMQNLLQGIDAKVSGGAAPLNAGASSGGPPPASNGPGSSAGAPRENNSGMPGISSDTLYQNGLRDFTSGNYDLARQEFTDFIANFPTSELASNAQFYLGDINYAQNDFKGAIAAYDVVLNTYPKSFKLAASLLKRAYAELELGMKATATRDLREVVRRFPGSEEAHRAQSKLKEIGAAPAARSAPQPH